MATALDQTTTQVIGNSLATAAEQMGLTLIRTAYSPNINERADCSTAIFDASGNVVAQAPRIPLHLGSMLGLVEETVKRHSQIRPGDMFVANDPYAGGGSHLPDVTVVAPVFAEGELIAFVANIAHHSDVGGMVPGSETPQASEIYQEGLRLSPVRLVSGGEVVQDIIDLVALNSRSPRERIGDLWAQLSANRVGEREFLAVVAKYGAGRVRAAMRELLDHAERRFRARVAELPDGNYRATQFMDNDGVGEEPIGITVEVRISGDSLVLDFEGTHAELRTSRNVPPRATLAVVYCVLKTCLDPDLPPNSGYFRAVDVRLPAGSFLNPTAPAAIAQRAYSCQVISDVLVLALNHAIPDLHLAGSGPFLGATFSGIHPDTGRYWVDHESWAGALGARQGGDGLDAVRVHHSNAANLPVEYLEAAYPMLLDRYELIQDSGGPGRWRGGLGVRREYRVLAPSIRASLFGERRVFPAPGVLGGQDGRVGSFRLRSDGSERELTTQEMLDIELRRGDVLVVETPGAGGCGKPDGRTRDDVKRDVIDQRVSAKAARARYGMAR